MISRAQSLYARLDPATRPPRANALIPMLELLQTLGALYFARRRRLVCLRPAHLPKVSDLASAW